MTKQLRASTTSQHSHKILKYQKQSFNSLLNAYITNHNKKENNK